MELTCVCLLQVSLYSLWTAFGVGLVARWLVRSGGKIGMPPLRAHFLDVTLPRLAAQWPGNDLQLDLAVYGLRDARLFGGAANAMSVVGHLRSLTL